MSAQSNVQLAREVYNLFSNNDLEGVVANAADDIEVFFAPTGQTFTGRDGLRQFLTGFKMSFPNVHLTIKNQVVTDDVIVTEFVAEGINTGPLMTPQGQVPATGRTAEWPVCEVWHVRDGKIAAISNYQDFGSVLAQLGAL